MLQGLTLNWKDFLALVYGQLPCTRWIDPSFLCPDSAQNPLGRGVCSLACSSMVKKRNSTVGGGADTGKKARIEDYARSSTVPKQRWVREWWLTGCTWLMVMSFANHIDASLAFNCRFFPAMWLSTLFWSDMIRQIKMKEHESMPTFFESTLHEEASLFAVTFSHTLRT